MSSDSDKVDLDSLINSWISEKDTKHILDDTKEEKQEFIPRPSRLGLGAKFVAHSDLEAKQNSKLYKRIKNDKRKRKNDNDERIKKTDYEDYDDEESLSKGEQFSKSKKLKIKL